MTTPNDPKLPAQLVVWDGSEDDEIEVDCSVVTDADFSQIVRLNSDMTRFERVFLTGAVLSKFELTDVECSRLEAAGIQAYKANALRVHLSDSRLTGAEFAESHFKDCVFKNVKLDEAGFRFASFERVRFENCMLRASDFENTQFRHVTFTGCDLNGAIFTSALCKDVDIRGEDITKVHGVLGLRGATISTEQLIQLAPLLATELGFSIEGQ